MQPLMLPLFAKIKTLNETVWERRATEPAVLAWLQNFASPDPPPAPSQDEAFHALFLLSNLMYFGSRQIRALLRALYRDLYRYPIIEAIRRSHGDTVDSDVIDPLFHDRRSATRFLGMGNPSESGCHLLYYFRQENSLPKDLFIHSHQIFSRNVSTGAATLRDPAVTHYVFIDDFCGSGNQAIEYSKDLVEAIKALRPEAIVSYFALFASSHGLARIRNDASFDAVAAVYELDSSFRCFAADSRYFKTSTDGIDRTFCEDMCRRYGVTLVSPEHSLGYQDSQLLLGFHHNTPDNTLPIIWFDDPPHAAWTPIFRRYPKLEW